jgi:hypothetical protein
MNKKDREFITWELSQCADLNEFTEVFLSKYPECEDIYKMFCEPDDYIVALNKLGDDLDEELGCNWCLLKAGNTEWERRVAILNRQYGR